MPLSTDGMGHAMSDQQPRGDRAAAADTDVVAAYRSGLTIAEVAEVYGESPHRIAQLIVSERALRARRRRALRLVSSRA